MVTVVNGAVHRIASRAANAYSPDAVRRQKSRRCCASSRNATRQANEEAPTGFDEREEARRMPGACSPFVYWHFSQVRATKPATCPGSSRCSSRNGVLQVILNPSSVRVKAILPWVTARVAPIPNSKPTRNILAERIIILPSEQTGHLSIWGGIRFRRFRLPSVLL